MACITPLEIQHDGAYYKVPCGKCPECLKRRTSGWSFRLEQESKRSTTGLFITLTYNNDHIPRTGKNYKTIRKDHVQKFMKRLRKLCPNTKLKYYAVGEYGTDYMRPHYHLILFNSNIDHVKRAWALDNKEIGYVHYGTVTGASIGYCLKYMCKPKKIPQHKNDDRVPEFALMSKGLGSNYLTNAMIEWHKSDLETRMHCVLPGGKKIAMPRYYKDKIYDEVERNIIAKQCLIDAYEREQEETEKMLKRYGDDWEILKVEQHKHAFEKMYKNALKNRTI